MDRQFPQDILGYILAEVPDLYTLVQATQTSKRVYGAYQAHARGISKAVARNQIGSEFNLALMIAREQLHAEEHPFAHPPEPDLALAQIESVGDVEIRRLNRNHWTVRRFENFYSQR